VSRSRNGCRGCRNSRCGSELWSKRVPKKGISYYPRHQEGHGRAKRFAKTYTVRYERRMAKAEIAEQAA
jgi:hypothetical protein